MFSEQENYFFNVTLQEAIDLESSKKQIVFPLSEIDLSDHLWKRVFENPDPLPNLYYYSTARIFAAKLIGRVCLVPNAEYARTQAKEIEKDLMENGKDKGVLEIKTVQNGQIVSTYLLFVDGSGIVCLRGLFGPFILLDKTEFRKKIFSVLIDYI